MQFENVLYEKKDGILYLTLNRPEKKNALTPEMWRDIVLNNNGPIVREIEAYIETLQRLKTTLGGGNPEEIFDLFSRVRELRNDWLDQRTNGWNS